MKMAQSVFKYVRQGIDIVFNSGIHFDDADESICSSHMMRSSTKIQASMHKLSVPEHQSSEILS